MSVGTGKRRFAFMTIGPFSGINASVLERLRAEFPQLEPDHIDIPSWVRGHRALMGRNLLSVLAKHGPGIFRDRVRLWGAFYRTPLIARAIRRAMSTRLAGGDYAFSLQTQSLFDGSVPDVPHFVYTDHTELVNREYADYDPARAPSEDWLALECSVYEHATYVFTMSTHVSRSLTEHYSIDPSRIRCVLAGSNVAREAGSPTPPPDYAGKRILFIGRKWERKGGPDLLAAFATVRAADGDATLAVVGCSPPISAPGVEVIGPLRPESLDEEYARAAVFCMPSLIEPFGIVFVEALSHALPVVSTFIGALPDIVQPGQSGYLHAPHDVDGLAESLGKLIADPALCRRLGENGRAFVQERYTWTHAVGLMADRIRASTS